MGATTGSRRAYRAHRRRQIAYGTWAPWGDLHAVRTHIAHLVALGHTRESIGRSIGLSPRHIRYLETEAAAVGSGTAERILATTPADITLGYLPADGIVRRLRALACLGWTLRAIAAESGVPHSTVESIATRPRCRETTAAAIRAAYDRLCMRIPPRTRETARVRSHAQRMGWVPPLSWPEDLIDLPEEQLAAEIERQVSAMDETELGRCYRAVLEGERSPVMAAAAPRYLAAVRERRERQKAA